MATFLSHLLEGQNLNELSQMARDGDPAHLGKVGFNLTLINAYERSRMEREMGARETDLRYAAENAERELIDSQNEAERVAEDRQQARHLSALKKSSFKELARALPDSNEGVDSFLGTF